MQKYALMCLNLPEWLLFYFPIATFQRVVTYFNVYTKLEVII